MLAHSFLIESSSKFLLTRTGIKAWTSSNLGLWFPWPIYMFFEWDLTLAHWTQVSDRCPLVCLFILLHRLVNHTYKLDQKCQVHDPAIAMVWNDPCHSQEEIVSTCYIKLSIIIVSIVKSTSGIHGESCTTWHTAWLNCATVGKTGM